LCRSAEIEVTPGTLRSNGGIGSPSSRRNGSISPPMQASTWHGTPRSAAAPAISSTGSTTPWPNPNADATTSTVRSSIAAPTASGSAWSVNGSRSVGTSSIPR
jgi:hypothetical protein